MDHNPRIPRTVTIMSSGSTNDREKIVYADMILDPAFPGQETVATDRGNTLLCRRFGIPIPKNNTPQSGAQEWSIRPMSNCEMLLMYSIPFEKLRITLKITLWCHCSRRHEQQFFEGVRANVQSIKNELLAASSQ